MQILPSESISDFLLIARVDDFVLDFSSVPELCFCKSNLSGQYLVKGAIGSSYSNKISRSAFLSLDTINNL